MDPPSNQVSFSNTSALILFTPIAKKEKSTFWYSPAEIALSKVMWAREIRKLQTMDQNESNQTDASDYMGLEKYLSKEQAEHCEMHRRQYIQSVVDMQNRLRYDELADFGLSQSRANAARSHKIAVFYASRHFEVHKCNTYKPACNQIKLKKSSGRHGDYVKAFCGYTKKDSRENISSSKMVRSRSRNNCTAAACA